MNADTKGLNATASNLASAVGGASSSAASEVNKMSQSTSPSIRSGRVTATDIAGATQYHTGVTDVTTDSSGRVMNADTKGLNATASNAYQTLLSKNLAQAKQRLESVTNRFGENVTSAVAKTLSNGGKVSHNVNDNFSIGQKQALSNAITSSFNRSFETSEQKSEAQAFINAMRVNIGGGVGTPKKFSIVKGEAGVTYSYTDQHDKTHTFTDTSKEALSRAEKFEATLSKEMAQSKQLSDVYQKSTSVSDSEAQQTMLSANKELAESYSEVKSYQEQLQYAETHSNSVGQNLLTPLVNEMIKSGEYTRDTAMKKLNAITKSPHASEELMNLMQKYGIIDNKEVQEAIQKGAGNIND
jgi:hypothetical protein